MRNEGETQRPSVGRSGDVRAYFDSQSAYWREIYEDRGLDGTIYRERQVAALGWIDALALPPGSTILELGCGAGFLSVELAHRGHRVRAVDTSQAMIELTRRHARESALGDRVDARVADAHALPFGDESFVLVVAIGVLPWLPFPARALAEIARVTAAGGHILATADNRRRLTHLLDPRLNPMLRPAREVLKAVLRTLRLLERRPASGIRYQTHHPREVDHLFARVGLTVVRRATVGFGPFTLAERRVLSERAGLRWHRRLQGLADRSLPGFRSWGAHYLVLARKSNGG